MVQCCLCSSKRQRMCIPTISGRFVSSSLHIYPTCSHCTAFFAPALCFYCYSRPACIWLGFVSAERRGCCTPQLTQLLVGIFENMIMMQTTKISKHFQIVYIRVLWWLQWKCIMEDFFLISISHADSFILSLSRFFSQLFDNKQGKNSEFTEVTEK